MRLLKRNKLGYVAAPLLSLLLGAMAGCGEDKAATAPCNAGGTAGGGGGIASGGGGLTGTTTLFVELVEAKENTPILGAQVGVDIRMRTSDPLGRLLFDNLPPGNKHLTFAAPEHVRMGMMTVFPEAMPGDPSWNASMRVSWKKRSAEVVCPKAEDGCVGDMDDVHLVIPANALRDPNKMAISGEVKLSLTRFDSEAELPFVPGSIETKDEMTGAVLPLRVLTMASLEVFQGDTPLSLIDGQAAHVEMLAPNPPPDLVVGAKGFVMDADAPAWKDGGKGTFVLSPQSGKPTWSAEIPHLGFYAAAAPALATMRLRIEVKDAVGDVFVGAYAQATSKVYRSHATGFTGRDGVLELVVPRDEGAAPAFDLRLSPIPADQMPTPKWDPYADGVRHVLLQLAAPMAGAESCGMAGASRPCEDQSGTISCYTKYQFCDGLVWGACSSFGEQKEELCNGIDDDCDGKIDGPEAELGVLCDSGLFGVCAVGHVVACNAGGVVDCKADDVGDPEVCDGIDNDCDGSIDEDLPEVGQPCTPPGGMGQGSCAMATQVCVNGILACIPQGATEEVCNGQDDDCDGAVDELGDVVCGVGACQVTVPFCQKDTCTPLPPKALETCGNGIDDDCNGVTDNDCCDPTQTSCPIAPEICDGMDNDRDGKTDAADDVLYEDDGTTLKTYICCPTNGGMEKLGDGLDNDCDGQFDEYPNCSKNLETQNGLDENCNGLVDEGFGCNPVALEIYDGIDQNCNGVADEGLCGGFVFENSVPCPGWTLGNMPLVKDSAITTSFYGNVQIIANTYANGLFNAARYVLPMKKSPGAKNRFYWEVAVAPANMPTYPCIGVGTDASPMAASDANAIENCLYALNFTPGNGGWTGAIVSVLLDFPEGKVRYWVNGALTLEQSINPAKTYYPMSWLYSNQGDFLTHNFGPNFTYPISDLYEAPKPAP